MRSAAALNMFYIDDTLALSEEHPSNQVQMKPVATSLDTTLAERGKRYGVFKHHAQVTQDLKVVIENRLKAKGARLDADQKEAIDMIFHKIGRIVNGDPNYADSWIDIAGYAQLVADRLNGTER